MSKNKYRKVQTADLAEMRARLVEEEKVEAIAEIQGGVDAINTAIDFLKSHPAYKLIDRAGDLQDQAVKLGEEAKSLESKLGTVVAKQLPLQKNLQKEAERVRAELLTDISKGEDGRSITEKRLLWGNQFASMLNDAVQEGMKKESRVSSMQQELRELVAKAEEFRTAKDSAASRANDYREEAAALTKEASELLASVQ